MTTFPEPEGPFRIFRHEGRLRWRCSRCGEEGAGEFKVVLKIEDLKRISDLDDVLCLVQVEHAVRCMGEAEIWEMHSHKYVDYDRPSISFNKRLFVASTVPGEAGHYEDMTTFKPDLKEDDS